MLDKIKSVVNSWYIGMATTGLLGIALLIYGHKFYAGLALGWAVCKTWEYLTSK
jgi:hypothetical protein